MKSCTSSNNHRNSVTQRALEKLQTQVACGDDGLGGEEDEGYKSEEEDPEGNKARRKENEEVCMN